MDNYCVYRHTSPDGKVYIGITKRGIEKRAENGNGYKHNQHFHRAIQKYGWSAFAHEVLESNLSYERACAMEQELILSHNATDQRYGYNLESGGNACKTLSTETRKKLSAKKKGRSLGPMSEETKAKLSAIRKAQGNFRTGKKLSPETRARMSEAQKKVPRSGPSREVTQKAAEATRGKRKSEETRKKMSEAQRGLPHPRQMKSVVQIDPKTQAVIARFPSIKDAAKSVGGNAPNVSSVCRGINKTYRGFKWQYAIE